MRGFIMIYSSSYPPLRDEWEEDDEEEERTEEQVAEVA